MDKSDPIGKPTPPPYSRKNPYLAELTSTELLTKSGSEKETRHFVISLGDSGLQYTPGDSLGTFGRNPPELVDEVLALLGFNPDTPIKNGSGMERTLRQALSEDYTLNRANRKILGAMAEQIPQGEQRNRLMELVDNGELLGDYIYTRDYVDILQEFDEARFETPEAFLSNLSPIVPRLYSIASSMAVHPGEVHICIAIVRYTTHERDKKGLASGFFADHTNLFVKNIPIYVQESRTFRLPTDKTKDIIMVGPGTGIAPFRAFIEQRHLDGATGRNWLFFGEQRRASDFLYGDEFLKYQAQGELKLDLAFSRDQEHKIYVQHRMREQAREVWDWLQKGAYFYVCGDAKRMAKDVNTMLIEIAQKEGGLSLEAAAEYVNVTLMRTERRYLRDVY